MHTPQRLRSIFIMVALTALFAMGLTPLAAESASRESVDHIKGIGKYKFGQALKDIPVDALQPVDPRANGILLRVSPYGDNYLVTDVKGLTWGGIPVAGLILTFHDGHLIDFQIALKAKRGDFYVADRAFKEKYGPNDARTFPVETWTGSQLQVTLMVVGVPRSLSEVDPKSLDLPAEGRVELLDNGTWNKYLDAQNAASKAILDQRYKAASDKAKQDL